MYIEHLAIWTHDLERLCAFYTTFFAARAGDRYHNPATNFQSYFLRLDAGPGLELMQMPGIPASQDDVAAQFTGYIHMAVAVGEPADVDALTARLRQAGCLIVSEPRWTGDGYYESVVLDPDGNRVEITAGGGAGPARREPAPQSV